MALAETSHAAFVGTDPVASIEHLSDHVLVRLRGELDASTIREAAEVVTRAVTFEDADVVIDLAALEFMGAAGCSLLVNTSTFLQQRSRSLTVRSPSPLTSRLLDICDIGHLVEGDTPAPEDRDGP